MRRSLTACLFLLAATAATAAEIAPELLPPFADGQSRPVWIYFTDKGASEQAPQALRAGHLSERALARRAKVRPAADLVDWRDLPNDAAYLAALRDLGFDIRAESRWLAAVTVIAGPGELPLLAALPFVDRIEAVAAGRRVAPLNLGPAPPASGLRGERDDPLDYGGSLTELAQANVPALHEMGLHGEGVVVGMLDTGFNTEHEALAGVDVLGAWDFINDDPVVANEPGDSLAQQNHGTMTLSTIAGFMPGRLIGPAFAASFYLAKTEDWSQEAPIEEDWWVEGIEWLEAQGCDLVSSSLAYDDWYEFEDFDGNTAPTTIAADHAVALGLAVFNSAGNYRLSTGHIAVPADGDSVITIGAVDSLGVIAAFSSPGPTADGRIKPDLCAMGVNNNIVKPGTLDEYLSGSGTSFACPLAAGVGAMLLGAHPAATPMQLRHALRATASQPEAPDNDYGWGIIDAAAALTRLALTAAPAPAAEQWALRSWPNPFNPSTRIVFGLDEPLRLRLDIHDASGRRLRTLHEGRLEAGPQSFEWDGRDDRGRSLPSGLYVARLHGPRHAAAAKLLLLK